MLAQQNVDQLSSGEIFAMSSMIMILAIISITILVVFIIAMWKVFTKAGQPGWGCIIPIYNAYLMLKIAGRPGWWLLLLLIPVVNFVVAILVMIDIAAAFGKGAGFAIGLIIGSVRVPAWKAFNCLMM